jgi:di/tricarboxylate transporter
VSADAWVVLGVLVAILIALATDTLNPVVAMGGGLTVLLLTGTVADDVVLSGLSSPATATIAALYVVAGAVSATGAMTLIVDRLLFGRTGGVLRLVASTAAMSAFVPNTPLVALAAPRVVRWSRSAGRSASRLLMPLSFASILGGVITMLGTSTNLVVSDVLRSSGDEPLGIFEITPIGLPVAAVGIAIMALTAPFLLRDRTPAGAAMRDSARAFQIQMMVRHDGPMDGATIEQAGLRELDGLFLAALERGDQLVAARPDARLVAGDRLYFVGDVARLVDLQDVPGLVSAEQNHLLEAEGPGVRLFEAVVASGSDLDGSTLRDADFRSRYEAAVLAVHRADGDLRGKLGVIKLRQGDVLLVLAGADFARRWRQHSDFALVASVNEPPPARRGRAWVAGVAFLALIALAASGALSLFAASVVSAAFVVAGKALSLTEARRAVNLNVILTIAASISLGNAVATSGLAGEIGAEVVRLGEPLGAAVTLYFVILATQLLTEVLSNSGAAALMVPVGMAAAPGVGGDPREFAIGVLIGASCSFLTPIGYQTNLMVYGLGGYKFSDFTRAGIPLTISSGVLAALLLDWL